MGFSLLKNFLRNRAFEDANARDHFAKDEPNGEDIALTAVFAKENRFWR